MWILSCLTFSSHSLSILSLNLKPILGLLYLFLIFNKFEKGYSGFVKGNFLGLWYRICWVCEKCLDLGIDIKILVGCWFDFFFFFWNWKICLVAKKMDNKMLFSFNFQWVLMCLVIKKSTRNAKKKKGNKN